MGRPKQFEPDVAVDRAMDLFWQQGYAGTTPAELTAALGIGKGSLYNAFGSKHDLFLLVLRRYTALRLAELRDTLSGPGPIAPRLRTAVRMLSGLGVHERGCVMVNAVAELGGTDAAAAAIATELFQGIESAFDEAVVRGVGSGEFVAGPQADVAGAQLLAAVIGLSVLGRAGVLTEEAVGAADATISALGGRPGAVDALPSAAAAR